MDENGEKQNPTGSDPPVDMAVAMDAARELSPEMLAKAAEIVNESLSEAQQEEEMYALLNEFNQRVNELYRIKLKEKMDGGDR